MLGIPAAAKVIEVIDHPLVPPPDIQVGYSIVAAGEWAVLMEHPLPLGLAGAYSNPVLPE